ncbi:response regulator transcription factor [uncultured Azohydromonas sp.]|jgi:Response regulator containing a CheY-like receiver domain and an HTH DNA-binding domain|uniref:response regulator n=1 Tax=uncultured Azohydromonas sp. TaxID=487342 RepID=UPI0026098A5B|nr:response regulator transcription factor [uncultured Azohydromonas sp.]
MTASAPARTIRVLLTDDHALVLWGLRQLIDSARPRMAVIGTASSARELMEHPALRDTDLVLLDLGLPDGDPLECIRRLTASGLKVLVLTGNINVGQHMEAVKAGARGVVLKSHSTELLLRAIDRVHAGEVWVERALMAQLLGSITGAGAAAAAMPSAAEAPQDEQAQRIASLTPKERQVVQALVQHRGAKSLVVAETLAMSEHTLRNHLTVIYSKLNVHGRLELYAYALEHGLAQQGMPQPQRDLDPA